MHVSVKRRLQILAGIVAALGMIGAAPPPAAAHHPIVSGSASCSADGQMIVVTWVVQNSETVSGSNRTMTVLSPVVSRGTLVGITHGMTVAPRPLAGSAVTGTTTFPATATGSVQLTVTGRWPSPGPQNVTASAVVQLPDNCPGPASAKVKKVTVPAGSEAGWTFTLTGPGTPQGGEKLTTSGASYAVFDTTLQPGQYTISEDAKAGFDFTSTSGSCTFTVVYPNDAGRKFACTFTNTERGSLEVVKTVDWNGVTPDQDQTFTICITGPSYPNEPNCKNSDFDGGKLTWTNLLPGDYVVSENDPGSSWTVSGGNGATAHVDPGEKTTAAGITNTRKLGSLQITKHVDWNGVTPNENQTFSLCITGPSYPNTPNCKTADFDGAVLTWYNLEPGSYAITENGLLSAWIQTGDDSVVVPTDGGSAAADVTNTRKHGSLQITKTVDWNGVTPSENQTFSICIQGPSYPNTPNCKTADFDGATLTWSDLIPGSYAITEDGLSTVWVQTGDDAVTVPANGGTGTAEVVNTRKLGSLSVDKVVDWNGVTPNENQTFSICISGPSYPNTPDCKTADFDGGKLTWNNLIPGAYAITEDGLSSAWIQTGDDAATVPSDGGAGSAEVTNTRKLGSLEVTKAVDWNGVTPTAAEFSICIAGPSYPDGNCKTFTSPNGLVQTWSNLIPGAYDITEDGLSAVWAQSGDTTANVPSDGGAGSAEVVNTRKLGSLEVTKAVDWNGVTPVADQHFSICITGASYPQGDCKTFTSPDELVHTWSDLIPGAYAITEAGLSTAWTQTGDTSAVVPSEGGLASAEVTNTRKLGALAITKSIDWNGVDEDDADFSICIAGPSFSEEPDCKTFTSPNGLTQTWTGLIPGTYAITEDGLGVVWTQSGDTSATVPVDGGVGEAVVTNTRKLGSLEVTKAVDWNGVAAEETGFSICIAGPSYPEEPNCKTFTAPDDLLQTWDELIPGEYTISEDGLGVEWTQSGDTSATVPADGGVEEALVTNTRKLGSLSVDKVVDWNGVTPDEDAEFSLCISGPSYPDEPNCKPVDFDGGTLTWNNLIPGNYAVGERNPGVAWTVTSSVTGDVVVPIDGGAAGVVPVITNTLNFGSLAVTKVVNWNNTPVVATQTFEICITGKSHPAPTAANGGCQSVGSAGGVLTWDDLIPGVYAVRETDPGASWNEVVSADEVLVPSAGEGTATVTNTHLPAEALGQQLARTGVDDGLPLALATATVLLAAARRLRKRR